MKPIQDEIFSTIDTIQGEPFSGVSNTNIVRTIGLKDAARRIRTHNKIHFGKERNSLIITEILESCARLLEDIDAGKVKYVKYGEWIPHHTYRDMEGDICEIFKCSNCDQLSEDYNYCPYCGANMKELEE